MNLYKPTDELKVFEGVYKTSIKGLWYLERKQFEDERGFFAELAYIDSLSKLIGKPFLAKQINHSRSKKNVVRGMHAEDWKKLAMVIYGVSFSVLVDIRPESETFMKKESFKLGDRDGALNGCLFIEEGIANSICTLSDHVDYVYYVDKLYKDRDPAGDIAISVFDKDLAIEWPINEKEMVISDRDRKATTLREKFPDKF